MDEFAQKLVNGLANEPSDFYALREENEKLKAQLEAFNERSIEFIQAHLEKLFEDKGIKGNQGISEEQFSKMKFEYEEIKKMIHQVNVAVQNVPRGGGGGGVNNTSDTYLVPPKDSSRYQPNQTLTSRTLTGIQFSHHLQPPDIKKNVDNSIT